MICQSFAECTLFRNKIKINFDGKTINFLFTVFGALYLSRITRKLNFYLHGLKKKFPDSR